MLDLCSPHLLNSSEFLDEEEDAGDDDEMMIIFHAHDVWMYIVFLTAGSKGTATHIAHDPRGDVLWSYT